ncbi:hypothetical protein BH10BAC1_BH10BAC1_16430 [soil metagenome]
MKKLNSIPLKALFIIAFAFFSIQSISQTDNFPAQFHYNSKSGRFQK